MTWILEEIVEVVLKWIVDIMNVLLSAFTSVNFDIGYSPEEGVTGFFDQVFPMGDWPQVFLVMGAGIAVVIALIKWFQVLMPSVDNDRELMSPMKTASNLAVSLILVVSSYPLFILFETAIKNACQELGIVMGFSSDEVTIASGWETSMFADTYGDHMGIAKTIIVLTFMFALLTQFIRMLFEFYSRYILLGAFFYLAPLGCATYVTKGQSRAFSSYIQSIMSTSLLMILDLFFLKIFVTGFGKVFSANYSFPAFVSTEYEVIEYESQAYFANLSDFIIKMALLIGWLYIGTNVDKYVRELGIATPQSGGGLGGSILGGVAGTATVARLVERGVSAAARLGGRISSGVKSNKIDSEVSSGMKGDPASMTLPKDSVSSNPANRNPETGELKPEAKYSFMGPDSSLRGQEARGKDAVDLAKYTGTDLHSDAIKNQLSGSEMSNTVASDGKVEFRDMENQAVAAIYNESWTPADGGGSIRTGISEHGDPYYMAATKEMIQDDVKMNLDWINDARQTLGISRDAVLTAQTDSEGQYTGNIIQLDKGGNVERVFCNSGYSALSEYKGIEDISVVSMGETRNGASLEMIIPSPEKEFDEGSLRTRIAANAYDIVERYSAQDYAGSKDLQSSMRKNIKSQNPGIGNRNKK